MAIQFDYKSKAWQTLRNKACRRAGYLCEWCRADVSGRHAARVDHRLTVKEYPELSLVLENLRVLCTRCDAARHADKGNRNVPRVQVGLDGFPLES